MDRAAQAKAAPNQYIPSFDGLRAFAVLAVIAYHMNLPYMVGGLLGVTVFFVLSGYLITSLLLKELATIRTIRLKRFWIRRIRRLFPAILLVLGVVTPLCAIFNQDLLLKVRDDFAGALFWFINWHYIFNDASYFDQLGAPSPLKHFWSLAIEEQFYLVWPLVLLGLYKLGVRRKATGRIVGVLAVISAILMAVLYVPGSDPSRVYYGTDTRAFSLLIGAFAAYYYPPFLPKWRPLRRFIKRNPVVVNVVGFVCCAALLLSFIFWDGMDPSLYRGGLVVVSIFAILLIMVLATPETILAKAFAWEPLVWIGKRSYGMYLWHFPVIILCTPIAISGSMPWWLVLIEFAAIVVISHLSYELVESPIRRGIIGETFRKAFPKGGPAHPGILLTGKSLTAVVLTAVMAFGTAISLSIVAPLHVNALAERLKEESRIAEEREQARLAEQKRMQEQHDAELARVYDPVWIGDSVSLAAVEPFDQRFPAGFLSAKKSRQFAEAIDIVGALRQDGVLGRTVILALGTNGIPRNLDETLDAIGADHEIYLMTVFMPDKAHQEKVNGMFRAAAEARQNVHVLDWSAVVANHPEWLWDDGEHLRPEGAVALVNFVYENIGNLPDIVEADQAKRRFLEREQAKAQAQAQGEGGGAPDAQAQPQTQGEGNAPAPQA